MATASASGPGAGEDRPTCPDLSAALGEFLKRKVVQNLLKWFQSRGIEPPEDMLTPTERRIGSAAEAIGEVVESQRLRDMIISAVRAMTYDELSQVTFPAAVWLRIHEEPKREK